MTGRQRALLVLLALTFPGASAHAADVSGSWQANLDCDRYATATVFYSLAHDTGTGAVSGTAGPECGTIELDDVGIERIGTCSTSPATLAGQVSGAAFSMPVSGPYTSDSVMATPFQFSSCTVGRIIVDSQLTGTITEDGAGNAVSIAGNFVNGAAEFRRPDGSLCFGGPNLVDCTFDMRRNDVPVGTDVTVAPNPGVRVTFATVTAPGVASAVPLTASSVGVPTNFQLYGNGGKSIFWDVHTTATIAGPITTCVSYPDADANGIVDGSSPPLDEGDLQMLHEEAGVFVDRTVSRDPTADVVCATTSSLSEMALGAPASTQPTIDRSIAATKLTMRLLPSGKHRLVFVSKDPGLELPQPGDPDDPRLDGVGGQVDIFSSGEGVWTQPMPSGGWIARSKGGFEYRITRPRSYGDDITVAQPFRSLRVSMQQAPVPMLAPHGRVAIRIRIGQRRNCVIFENTSIRRDLPGKFIGTRAGIAALPDCSDATLLGTGSPSGAFVGP